MSCQPGQIDSADTIVSRVEQALKYLAPHRITLNPDCGFAPGSAAEVSLDEVYTKLKNEVAAAVIWLCSEAAAGVNGAAIPISGGEVT